MKAADARLALPRLGSAVPILERVTGIEPVYSAWKAAVLPLYYTRIPLKSFDF